MKGSQVCFISFWKQYHWWTEVVVASSQFYLNRRYGYASWGQPRHRATYANSYILCFCWGRKIRNVTPKNAYFHYFKPKTAENSVMLPRKICIFIILNKKPHQSIQKVFNLILTTKGRGCIMQQPVWQWYQERYCQCFWFQNEIAIGYQTIGYQPVLLL